MPTIRKRRAPQTPRPQRQSSRSAHPAPFTQKGVAPRQRQLPPPNSHFRTPNPRRRVGSPRQLAGRALPLPRKSGGLDAPESLLLACH
eukprot:5410158-Alexandrium_andersonii.AAC.1